MLRRPPARALQYVGAERMLVERGPVEAGRLGLGRFHRPLFERRRATKQFFQDAREKRFETVRHDFYETLEKEHGRLETRKYWVSSILDWCKQKREWAGLCSVGMVESTREIGGRTSTEIRYFISSLAGDSAKKFAHAVRSHWAVENSLHWVLDTAFDEDQSLSVPITWALNHSLMRATSPGLSNDSTAAEKVMAALIYSNSRQCGDLAGVNEG